MFGSIGTEVEVEAPSEAEAEDGNGRAEDGAIKLSGEDFMPWVLRGWALMALAGWLIGMLRAAMFGPREPMRLKRKPVLAAVPAIVCAGLFCPV